MGPSFLSQFTPRFTAVRGDKYPIALYNLAYLVQLSFLLFSQIFSFRINALWNTENCQKLFTSIQRGIKNQLSIKLSSFSSKGKELTLIATLLCSAISYNVNASPSLLSIDALAKPDETILFATSRFGDGS